MHLIRLIMSTVFIHGLLSNPARQGHNEAFIADALGLTDALLEALTANPNPEEPADVE